MLSEDHIREALRDCYDPEIPLNIVELGLLESIVLAVDSDAPGAGIPGVPQRYSVTIVIVPASHGDGAEAQLAAQIRNRLAGIFELSSTTIQIEDAPLWTPSRISAQGRRLLGLDQPQFPILNNKVRTL